MLYRQLLRQDQQRHPHKKHIYYVFKVIILSQLFTLDCVMFVKHSWDICVLQPTHQTSFWHMLTAFALLSKFIPQDILWPHSGDANVTFQPQIACSNSPIMNSMHVSRLSRNEGSMGVLVIKETSKYVEPTPRQKTIFVVTIINAALVIPFFFFFAYFTQFTHPWE